MIIALAFVPANDVIYAVNILENNLDDRCRLSFLGLYLLISASIAVMALLQILSFLYHFGMFTLALFLIFIAQIITQKPVIAKINVTCYVPPLTLVDFALT